MLADWLPGVARSKQAVYAGSIRAVADSNEVLGTLHGRFENLELSHWLGSASRHQLQATGNVQFDELRWREERVEVAHGELQATRGSISHSLLSDCQQRLFCEISPDVLRRSEAGSVSMLKFDELSCGFHLTGAGLTLTGRCHRPTLWFPPPGGRTAVRSDLPRGLTRRRRGQQQWT